MYRRWKTFNKSVMLMLEGVTVHRNHGPFFWVSRTNRSCVCPAGG